MYKTLYKCDTDKIYVSEDNPLGSTKQNGEERDRDAETGISVPESRNWQIKINLSLERVLGVREGTLAEQIQ